MNEVLTSILKEVIKIKKVPTITLTFLQVTELENHTLTSRLASLLW